MKKKVIITMLLALMCVILTGCSAMELLSDFCKNASEGSVIETPLERLLTAAAKAGLVPGKKPDFSDEDKSLTASGTSGSSSSTVSGASGSTGLSAGEDEAVGINASGTGAADTRQIKEVLQDSSAVVSQDAAITPAETKPETNPGTPSQTGSEPGTPADAAGTAVGERPGEGLPEDTSSTNSTDVSDQESAPPQVITFPDAP